ncbi:MAG: helix-turn-helix transcriptional regulator, partial [Actinobacteria bacterium]|nr:helix-turn-helix transcriptional regulator [Actinomycetota bacterium]
RAEAGLSQRALSSRAGCTRSTIARIESGEMDPTVTMLARITAAAGRRLNLSATESPHRHSLAAIAVGATAEGKSEVPWTQLRGLLDWVHLHVEYSDIAIGDPPTRTHNEQLDNLLAAVAEKIADDRGMSRPAWTHDVPRLSDSWVAPGTPRMQAREAAHAPAQFLDRNILIAEENLWRHRGATPL